MDSPSLPEEQGLRDLSTSPLTLLEVSGRGGRSRAADRVMRKADECQGCQGYGLHGQAEQRNTEM